MNVASCPPPVRGRGSGSSGTALSVALQAFGRNDGAPVFVMISTITSTLLNIFLDWLFVFPLQMGLAGAAIATGLSQTAGLLIVGVHFVRRRGILHFSKFAFDGGLIQKVLKRGLPEMLSQFTTPIMIFCMNLVLARFVGEDGINAFSIIGYIISFAFAVFIGVSEGMQPLFGRCFGDKAEADLKYYKRFGMISGFIGSAAVYGLILVLGGAICKMFGADQDTTDMAIAAIPKFGWAFLLASLNTIISAYLYSTKRTKESVGINILRGFVFIPLAVILLSFLSNGAVLWYTVGIAEAVTLAAAVGIMRHSEKNGVQFDRR